ncbi:MAG: hypothetical protein L0H70_09490 [Xanthomonadales bacterium]|nr:hypothetical protein [Xanthomonadales bacterium]
MNLQRYLPAVAAMLLTSPVLAQTNNPPLKLKLPVSTTLPAASSSTMLPLADAPGKYYGDTSGRTYHSQARAEQRPSCDDATYNQAQVHGNVGVGVVGGNHVHGHYETGTVNLSKLFGSCANPRGNFNLSISVGRGRFHGH